MQNKKKAILLTLLRKYLCICCLLISPVLLAEAPLTLDWSQSDKESLTIVDHGLWDDFLKRYVVEDPAHGTTVNYSKVSPIDYKRLSHYINTLEKIPVLTLNPNEQKAFWINLYNAVIVKVILDHMPVRTIRDVNISDTLFKRGPWDANLLHVENVVLSLNDIRRIVRASYHDNRIFYALCDGTASGPALAPRPYEGRKIHAQLNNAASFFINNEKSVHFKNDHLMISELYYRNPDDFGTSEVGILEHLVQYAKEPLKTQLMQYSERLRTDARIFYVYDWSLNE